VLINKHILLAAGLPAFCLALSACETYDGYGYGGYGGG
jgi:predicted small secreted protein